MDTIQDAQQVLREAEGSLRRLMEQGLKHNRYADVAQIAPLADGISRLLRGESAMGTAGASHSLSANGVPAPRRPRAGKSAPRKGPKGDYPRFERDGDRLVKIGWSKKNRAAYEHRAPREAVNAFVRHLATHVAPGKVFAMEDVMPVPDPGTGDDLPAYQAYLVLAWLRHVGAVEKKGRAGYVLRNASFAGGEMDSLFAGIPVRSA